MHDMMLLLKYAVCRVAHPHGHICLPGFQVTSLLIVQVHGATADDSNDMHVKEEIIVQATSLQQLMLY